MDKYTFKRMTLNNISDLFRLFSLSAKKTGNKKKYADKYNTKYTGVEYIGYFAYDEKNQPVAFYGATPCFALANNEKILIAQAVDAITHPDHRRQGLFEKIVSLTTDLAKAEDIHFIYGVPNDLSYQGFIKKFHWQKSHHLVKFQLKTMQLPISYFFKRYPSLNRMYLWYVKFILRFYPKGDVFPNPSADKENITLLRDSNYFSYKNYIKKHLIKICGLSIWFSIDGAMKIGDIEISDHIEIKQLIGKIRRLAFLLGISKVVFQFSPGSIWVKKMSRKIKAEMALPIIYFNISNRFSPEKLAIAYGDIDTF